jgi:hypothetical protein
MGYKLQVVVAGRSSSADCLAIGLTSLLFAIYYWAEGPNYSIPSFADWFFNASEPYLSGFF